MKKPSRSRGRRGPMRRRHRPVGEGGWRMGGGGPMRQGRCPVSGRRSGVEAGGGSGCGSGGRFHRLLFNGGSGGQGLLGYGAPGYGGFGGDCGPVHTRGPACRLPRQYWCGENGNGRYAE